MLRRHLSKLKSEVDTSILYANLSAKSKKTHESRDIIERRVVFLEDVLIERCYLAFGGVVADNQYAALGLMLIGTLARVRKVIGPLRREGDGEGRDMIRVEEMDGKELDLGEFIRREELVGKEGGEGEPDVKDVEEGAGLKTSTAKRNAGSTKGNISITEDTKSMKRPKKKRKKGDVFDDLFEGLV